MRRRVTQQKKRLEEIEEGKGKRGRQEREPCVNRRRKEEIKESLELMKG